MLAMPITGADLEILRGDGDGFDNSSLDFRLDDLRRLRGSANGFGLTLGVRTGCGQCAAGNGDAQKK